MDIVDIKYIAQLPDDIIFVCLKYVDFKAMYSIWKSDILLQLKDRYYFIIDRYQRDIGPIPNHVNVDKIESRYIVYLQTFYETDWNNKSLEYLQESLILAFRHSAVNYARKLFNLVKPENRLQVCSKILLLSSYHKYKPTLKEDTPFIIKGTCCDFLVDFKTILNWDLVNIIEMMIEFRIDLNQIDVRCLADCSIFTPALFFTKSLLRYLITSRELKDSDNTMSSVIENYFSIEQIHQLTKDPDVPKHNQLLLVRHIRKLEKLQPEMPKLQYQYL